MKGASWSFCTIFNNLFHDISVYEKFVFEGIAWHNFKEIHQQSFSHKKNETVAYSGEHKGFGRWIILSDFHQALYNASNLGGVISLESMHDMCYI